MGAKAYGLVERHVPSFGPGECAIEIGSERGEGSTAYLAAYCQSLGAPFLSVDFSKGAYERARVISGVTAFCEKAERFLTETLPALGLKVRFAYLDNFDWIWKACEGAAWIQDQIEGYAAMGLTMNNANSQEAHLRQSELLLPYFAVGAVILFDDTWQRPDREFDGKGGTAVPFLLRQGFQLAEEPPTGEERTDGFVILKRVP